MSQTIDELIVESHQTAVEHGWWEEQPPRSFGDQIALMHSELSEALEQFREHHHPSEIYIEDAKPEGVAVELADVLIRIFDTCGYYGVDLQQALTLKLAYNKTRPYRHGGKAS